MSRAIETSARVEQAAVGLASLVVVALAPVSWRLGLSSALAALLGLALRVRWASALVHAFGFATLAAAAVADGGTFVRVTTVLVAAACVAALLLRPARWPPGLVAAAGIGGALAAVLPLATSALADEPLARAPGLAVFPAVVAAFVAVLLFVSAERERQVPAAFLALFLAIPAAAGLLRFVVARTALSAAKKEQTLEAWTRARDRAEHAGWRKGESAARFGEARELLAGGRASAALALVPPEFALDGSTTLLRAEALRALGRGPEAMALYRKATLLPQPAPVALAAEGAAWLGLWQRRGGQVAEARVNLRRGVGLPAPGRYAAELAPLLADPAEAARLLEGALAKEPGSAHALCALAELQPREIARARACLDVAPLHRPSLALEAAQGDAEASRVLAHLDDLPAADVSFEHVIKLVGARVGTGRVARGARVPLELAFDIEGACAPSEHYLVMVHVEGAGFFTADHVIPRERHAPSWVRGERLRYGMDMTVPGDAPAGSYNIHLALYSPDSGTRLQPLSEPWHIQFIKLGTLEVQP